MASDSAHRKLPQMQHLIGKKEGSFGLRQTWLCYFLFYYLRTFTQYLFYPYHYIECCMTSGKGRNSARDKAIGDGGGTNTGLVPFLNTGKDLLLQFLSLAQLSRGLAKGGQERHDHPKGVCRIGKKMPEVSNKS